ncbi:MAG: hypothetical protein M9921_07115 [Fimbriimonadaceae bacterium]|nr:hypothetical protein [Fimbriimonadaceae bacterium]
MACGVALFRTVGRVEAAVSVRQDPTQYLIASWRPVREDLALATRLDGVTAVRYTRGETEFVRTLLGGVGLSEAEAKARGIVVFEGTNCLINRLGSGKDPLGAALVRADRERRSSEPSKIPMAVLGGVLLGVWLRFGTAMLRFGALAAMGLAAYQWMTACPTCPSLRLAGVPVSILGACLYGALGIALASRRWDAGAAWVAAPLAAGVLAWQSIAALVTGTDCGPCAGIACLNAALSVSALAHGLRRVAPSRAWGVRRTAVGLALALAASIGASQFASQGRAATPHAPPPPSLAGYRIQDLGLQPNGHARLIFVAMSECRLCHGVLEYLGRHPEVDIEVYFTDRVPPAYQSFASLIPDPHWIATTPAFLVADKSGTIAVEEKGWTFGDEWQKKFLDKLEASRVRLEKE